MSAEARSLILGRIQQALARPTPEDAVRTATEWQALSRDYDKSAQLPLEAMLTLLESRLLDYDAEVSRVQEQEVASTVATVLAARGNKPTLMPPGLPLAWIPSGTELVQDADFPVRELDRFDGIVTGATVAIAETGTLVLQAVSGQGRRAATLVPDFHLCIVRVGDVVQTVPEAFVRLAANPTLPTTFISGPSATADIEMTRIRGVHGPRFLHVLLVSS